MSEGLESPEGSAERGEDRLEATRRLQQWFDDYASHHVTAGNQLCHQIGIPLIAVTLLGLLAEVTFPSWSWPAAEPFLRADLGLAVWLLALIWYFTLDWRLALPFGIFALGLYWIGRALPVPLLWFGFVAGWIIQFIGHARYEKRSPAFFQNVRHLLIGPFWIFAKGIGFRR